VSAYGDATAETFCVGGVVRAAGNEDESEERQAGRLRVMAKGRSNEREDYRLINVGSSPVGRQRPGYEPVQGTASLWTSKTH